jgi:hypothetical protein
LTDAERRRKALDRLNDLCPGSELQEYEIKGLASISGPVDERIRFTGGQLAKGVGELLILEPGRSADPPISGRLPSPPRHAPLDLGLPRQEQLRIVIHSPPGWMPEEVPSSFSLVGPHLTIRADWSLAGDTLTYSREATVLSPEVPADDYEEFRDAVTKLRGSDRTVVVFVRR